MIDIDKYESAVYKVTVFLEDNEQYGDDWSKERKELNDLLADVKHYSAQLEETRKQLAQAEGATQMALEHLGYQGADHDEFCRFKYGCNVYGDELEEEE